MFNTFTNTFTYKVARIFWSIYFVLTIGIVGIICGYFLTFFVFFMAFLLSPWSWLSEKIYHLAEDIQCLSIRMLLRMQPWLKCRTNFPSVVGFYRQFSHRRIVFVANHRSNFDTFLMISYVPGLRGLAKSTLFYNVFFAPFMWVAGFIPVHKGSPESFLEGLNLLKEKVLERNRAVLVFPENTRCEKNFAGIQKFSGAFFSLAMKADAVIVPVVIDASDQVLGKGDLLLRPCHQVRIQMLAPIEARQYSDFVELKESIWRQMNEVLATFRKEVSA